MANSAHWLTDRTFSGRLGGHGIPTTPVAEIPPAMILYDLVKKYASDGSPATTPGDMPRYFAPFSDKGRKFLHIRQAHNLSAWHGRHGEWCSTDSPGQLDPIAQLLAVGSDWLACLSWKVLQVSSLHTKSYKWNHMTLDQTRKRPLCFWFVHFSSVKMQLGRPQTRSV